MYETGCSGKGTGVTDCKHIYVKFQCITMCKTVCSSVGDCLEKFKCSSCVRIFDRLVHFDNSVLFRGNMAYSEKKRSHIFLAFGVIGVTVLKFVTIPNANM